MSISIFNRAQQILSARQAQAEATAAQKAENEVLLVSLFEGTPEGAYLDGGVCRLLGNAIFGGPHSYRQGQHYILVRDMALQLALFLLIYT